MKRKIVAFLLMVAVLVMGTVPGQAYDAPIHNKQLEMVLLGKRITKHKIPLNAQEEAIRAIEAASYLCLDQFNGYGEECLSFLKSYHVPGLPELGEIDFTSNKEHRKFTHIGWSSTKQSAKGNWPTRKEILLATVNKVFDFGPFTDPFLFSIKQDYTRQCDAFCALVYYVHILGDIEKMKDLEQFKAEGSFTLPLARAHPGNTNRDILYELCEMKNDGGADDYYLKNLFPDIWETNIHCQNLKRDLQRIHRNAISLEASVGGINTEEKFQKYKQYCTDTINVLSKYIPDLLKQEKFFADVFYPTN